MWCSMQFSSKEKNKKHGKCGSDLLKQFSSVCTHRANETQGTTYSTQVMGNAVLSTVKSDTNYNKAIKLNVQNKPGKSNMKVEKAGDTYVNAVRLNWKKMLLCFRKAVHTTLYAR